MHSHLKTLLFLFTAFWLSACTQSGKEQLIKEVIDGTNADIEEKTPKTLFTGIRKSYYDDEEKQLMSEVEYQEGYRDGTAVDYYESGQVRLKGGNMMGKKHGDFVFYHEDGRVYRKMSYDYGDLHGWDTLFYKSGKPKHAIPYDDGEVLQGTVEWDARYQVIPLPSITIREVSRVDTEGRYYIYISFKENVKNAKFYLANMGKGTAENPEYQFEPTQKQSDAEALFVIPMQSGYELATKLVIKGEGITKRGNPFQVRQVFPVIIR